LTKKFNLERVAERVATRLDPALLAAVADAEDAAARLDERLRKSPLRDGFCARGHFADACASLWLAGQLVHLEDLVLHDAEMDLRTPTHELTRAHAVLRGRRRIAIASPGRFLADVDGLEEAARTPPGKESREQAPVDADDPLAAELAALDAAIARSTQTLRDTPAAAPSGARKLSANVRYCGVPAISKAPRRRSAPLRWA